MRLDATDEPFGSEDRLDVATEHTHMVILAVSVPPGNLALDAQIFERSGERGCKWSLQDCEAPVREHSMNFS